MLATNTGDISGILLLPESTAKPPVVLMIAGSGPTDRNGNNPMMTNNSLKMLAEGLVENTIASVRFDKRGVGQSAGAAISESELRFEDYIDDVLAWIDLLVKDSRFGDLIVLGHSEGSLIGMVAAQSKHVDKYISVAGAGIPVGGLLRKQLKNQPPFVLEQSMPIIEKLEQGETVENVPQMLFSLFRPSIQSYMISWMKYDPSAEIAKLKCPSLIIQGSTDIQVDISDAEKLSGSNKKAKKVIIDGMNHIFKPAPSDRLQNAATYNNPDLPLAEGFITKIVNFIKTN
jgi:pimeloyl-ACP methyl ester carboxylesterase